MTVRGDHHRRQMLAVAPNWAGASPGDQQRSEGVSPDGDSLRVRIRERPDRRGCYGVAFRADLQILHTPPQLVNTALLQRGRAEQAFDDFVAERQIGGGSGVHGHNLDV